jgi:hypothetical protein
MGQVLELVVHDLAAFAGDYSEAPDKAGHWQIGQVFNLVHGVLPDSIARIIARNAVPSNASAQATCARYLAA